MRTLLTGNWYGIPGFNGYFLNSNGQVLSMKNYIKYPNGYYLKHMERKDGIHYNLVDDNNEKHTIHIDALFGLVLSKGPENCFIIAPGQTYIASRNKAIMKEEKPGLFKKIVPRSFDI